MKEKCIYCNLEFESEELERHQFSCVSSYKCEEIDFSNKIPCEICNELIDFENYDRHINLCTSRSTSLPFLLNRISGNSPSLYTLFNLPNLVNPTTNNHISNDTIVNNINEENIPNNEELESEDNGGLVAESGMVAESDIVSDSGVNINNLDSDENMDNVTILDDTNLNIQYNMNLVNYNLNLINSLLNNNSTNSYDSYESYSDLDANIAKDGVDINKVSEEIVVEDTTKCPVCMDDFNKGSKMLKITCNHIFCGDCLDEWLSENKKCPVCMIEL